MTATQLAAAAGGLIGLGIALLVLRFVPSRPDLSSAAANLAPDMALTRSSRQQAPAGRGDRAGQWLMRHAPWLGRPPEQDMALLQRPLHRYYTEKVMYAAMGMVTPVILTMVVAAMGIGLPIPVPVIVSLGLAMLLSLIPDYNVRSDAAQARKDARYALIAYIDLVAMAQNAGSQNRQALEGAAMVGDSWLFRRLSEEFDRSRLSGTLPWDALQALSDELDMPALQDLADIMHQSGDNDSAVYEALRARASALRTAVTNDELGKANEVGERLSVPVALLSMIFVAILLTPALLRALGEGV